VLTKAEEMGR
jgi:hypothetical protein